METAIKPVPQKLTCEQIALSSEYRRLTKRMQKWAATYIGHYLATGEWDPVKATLAAFTSANLNVCRATTWRVKKHPQMKEVIDLFVNATKSPQALALEEIQRNIDAAELGSVAIQRFISMKHSLLRRTAPDEDDAPPPPVKPEPENRIPPGATAWYDKDKGVVIGYRTRDGKDVQL
jgi:hypothetical protein